MDLKKVFSHHTLTMKSSLIRELVASTKGIPGLISFAGGFPSPATFPKTELGDIFQSVVTEEGNDVLQYGASEGDTLLKKALLEYETCPELTLDEILITLGSTNGLYYFAKTFIDEGDVILCEAPSFLGTLVAFDAVGAELVPVEMDDDGIVCDKLSEQIKSLQSQNKKIKFIYTIPDFQNPTGITLSLARRKELIKIAIENDILIIEDDPYGELRYSGERIPNLIDIARNDFQNKTVVTCVKSFSKILGPGLRIAYIMGDEAIIQNLCTWSQKIVVSPDCVSQRAVARYMMAGKLRPHIAKICDFYRPYRDKMLESLKNYMPAEVKWTTPDGGIFVWLELPKHIDGDELFEKAKEYKVSFIPGSHFYPTGYAQKNTLRLNFSFPTLEQIDKGVEQLATLIKKYL